MEKENARRGLTQQEKDVVICPPCGESVALATKEGQNKKYTLWLLLPRLTAVLPQSGKTNFITLLWRCVPLPPHRGEDEVVINSLPQGREITVRGFTLIELLVVVLIIGILAAVAVPQYKFAVNKTRISQLITLGNTVSKAEAVYRLANGDYTKDWTALDIELPGTINANKPIYLHSSGWDAELSRVWVALWDNRIKGVRLYFNFNGTKACYARIENDSANELCKHFSGGTSDKIDGAWRTYALK